MNYTTTLVLAAFLLAQLVSCSGGGYKVVYKTSHSYVLRPVPAPNALFQENLHEAAGAWIIQMRTLTIALMHPTFDRHIRP